MTDPTRLGLHPGGILQPRGPDDLFRRLGIGAARCDLGDQGLYLAEELLRSDRWLGDGDREALACLILAVSVAMRQGSSRLPLGRKGQLRTLLAEIHRAADLHLDLDALDKAVERLTRPGQLGPTIGGAGDRRPLIVDGGCVYPQRLHWLECRVAAALLARLAAPSLAVDDAAIADVTARPSDLELSTEQAAAIRIACQRPLSLVAGGPGTGKTQAAVAIARALARHGVSRWALAAPTGKAAHRIAESFRRQLSAIRDPHATDTALAAALPTAQTLHRLLGYQPSSGRFRHDETNPLDVDAVIIDEASMIDLAMMERLLRAVAPTARVVLLGDPNQLPSVDAGQIVADLAELAGGGAPWAVTLTRNFRVGDAADTANLAEVADAVRRGVTDRTSGDDRAGRFALRAGADDLRWRGAELVECDPLGGVAGEVIGSWWRRQTDGDLAGLAHREYRWTNDGWQAGDEERLERLMAGHARSRLLAVTRAQPTGTVALNQRLHRRMLLEHSTASFEPDFVPGEPVIMTANDYQRELYNGDTGVIARVDDGRHGQRFQAIFRRGGRLVPFPLDALRSSLELAWAITVHKSQGSEWDDLILLLPADDLPLTTRELIYTALTRARRGAVVVGRLAQLRAAVARGATRHSGVCERVREGQRG